VPGFSEEDIVELLANEERKSREMYSTKCLHCRSVLGWYEYKYKPKRRLFSYDEETRIGYHDDCQVKYEILYKEWINMWAAVGWHAKVDLL